MILKDGTETQDRKLDRLRQFDERSRSYPISEVVPSKPRSYTWRVVAPYLIDQGTEGACVGYSVANELMARPAEVVLGSAYQADRFAKEKIYWEAQRIDAWDGGSYPGASPNYEGTSVLAGLKAAQRMGYFEEYRWAFDLADVVYGVGHNGPAVIGIDWYDSNYEPDDRGYIWMDGEWVGGHAILVRGIKCVFKEGVNYRVGQFADLDLDKSYFTLRNSWGRWGKNNSGDCYVTVREMGKWLRQYGEAAFAMKRKTKV